MAKFNQMSTKKLNSILETSTDETEKAEIMAVLNARSQATSSAPNVSDADALSPEEQAVIGAANNENGADVPVADKKPAKATKMSEAERAELADKLRVECVNHKCQVVPFNSITWVDGVVASIIEEKRTNKVLYAVKTSDGRRVVKAFGSELIKIFDEVVEPEKKTFRKASKEKPEWMPEDIETAINELTPNVGKLVSYVETGALGKAVDNAKTVTGRIVSLVPNKRTQTILYRIELLADEASDGGTKKYAHKSSSCKDLAIEGRLDEVGQKINEAFVNRRSHEKSSTAYTAKTNEEKLIFAKEKLAKFEAKLEDTKMRVEKWKDEVAKYEDAIKEASTATEEQSDADLM